MDVIGPDEQDTFNLSKEEKTEEFDLHEIYKWASARLLIRMQQEEATQRSASQKAGTAARWRLAYTNMATGVNVRGVGVLNVEDPDQQVVAKQK
ncbi:hypothetical protein CYMTET_41207 [Cymbomonas tetramitiformis]|uniref:Uncharacterized protein n=1 Tax=Cymbomonas tetramitiformis TaxID=36881 RepID=A0AAE0C6L8_9CHLO|nr:hypothetical protein CYMTET_41207 [Cymbomonas tetramitiformis]